MTHFGYKLMSEEHGPTDLVRNAVRAEEVGFDFAAISDHYHPWLESQGHSPFAWTVLGAIAARTQTLELVTAVTCPTIRYHPAIIAQASATLAILSGGRFTLGLGSGELLNEHVVGAEWPPPRVRQEMLAEAIDIIQELWVGEMSSYEGEYFEIDRARLWDVPERPPAIAVAAGSPRSARVAGEHETGLFATEPKARLIDAWREAGGQGPRYAEVALSWHDDEKRAIELAHERFRFGALGWKVMPDLPNPANFAAATRFVRPVDVAKMIPCGPDPERHVAAVKKYVDAGFDHVILVGIGPDQDGFFDFWERELAPRLRKL
jgi:G6PDH family F420-dependent oxidoreductase